MNRSEKIFILILAAFICGFVTGGCPAKAAGIESFKESELYSKFRHVRKGITEDMDSLVKAVEGYIENEQYTEAMLELNKLLDQNPDDPRIYILSAELLRKTYQFDEAERMAKKALLLDYKNSNAYLELGYIYFDKAKFSVNEKNTLNGADKLQEFMTTSFDHFFMASQYAPESPFPHIALAEAYYANRQKQRAKDEILKAKELAFSEPEAFYEIGQYYYKIKDYDKAKKYIEKAIESGRNKNYRAYYLVGRIAEQKGNIKEAQQMYLQTLRLKPDMLAAQKHLDALIKTTYKEKVAEETTSKDLFANVDRDLNLLMKADYYLMLDEYTRARDLYISLLERNPQSANAAAGLAELYYSRWKEGFPTAKNFVDDAIYIIKAEPSKRNKISFLKFQMINEPKIPEKVRQQLIQLSISETFEFYDLLNEVRAEYLLGNYEECHNKLYRLLNMKLSNYEKFKILKQLCYDHNYYEALIVIDELKKTYYQTEEIEPVESRIKTKLGVVDEKVNAAISLWQEKKYNKALSLYREVMEYFPAYKPAYLHYALAMDEMGKYNEAYDKLNIYYKLYKLYPDRNPEITEEEIKDLIQELYTKTRQQIKKKSKQKK